MTKLERWDAGGQNLIRGQYAALEASIALIMSDAYVNLAAFQHGGRFATKGLRQFHAHIGKTVSISRQNLRQNTFDRVGRGAKLKHPPSSTPAHSYPSPCPVERAQYP